MSDQAAQFIVHSILDDLPLTAVEFRLYAHAVRRGGLGGLYYESVPNAAAHCGVRDKTIRRAMKRLIALGLISLADTPPGRTRTYRVSEVDSWQIAPLSKGDPSTQTPVVKGAGRPSQKKPPHPGSKRQGTPTLIDQTKDLPVRLSLQGFPSKAIGDRDREIPGEDSRQDWHGLSLETKCYRVLGLKEMANNEERWQKRMTGHPTKMEEILDKMNADLKEGSVIKNRGAYAEQLWNVVMNQKKQ